MQADAFFASAEVAYAGSWSTGRRMYGVDVRQLSPQEAQAATRENQTDYTVPTIARATETVHKPTVRQRAHERTEQGKADEIAKMRTYVARAREKAQAKRATVH